MSDSGFNKSVVILYIDISNYMLEVMRLKYRHLSKFQRNSEICFHCIKTQNNYTQLLPKTSAVKCVRVKMRIRCTVSTYLQKTF